MSTKLKHTPRVMLELKSGLVTKVTFPVNLKTKLGKVVNVSGNNTVNQITKKTTWETTNW